MDDIKFQPLEPENPNTEPLPYIPEQMESLDDEPVIQELSFEDVPAAAEEAVMPEIFEAEQEITDAVTEAIQEDVPATDDFLEVPDTHPEIEADHHAMDFHGLMEHGQAEEPFDLSILEDPEFNPEPAPQIEEDPVDQEFRDEGQELTPCSSRNLHLLRNLSRKLPSSMSSETKAVPKREKGARVFWVSPVFWLLSFGLR